MLESMKILQNGISKEDISNFIRITSKIQNNLKNQSKLVS
jgi:hypothetical protein